MGIIDWIKGKKSDEERKKISDMDDFKVFARKEQVKPKIKNFPRPEVKLMLEMYRRGATSLENAIYIPVHIEEVKTHFLYLMSEDLVGYGGGDTAYLNERGVEIIELVIEKKGWDFEEGDLLDEE